MPVSRTVRYVRVSRAMLVGLPDDLATQCWRILAPIIIDRSDTIDEALERLPALRPLVVAKFRHTDAEHTAILGERALDVGAAFVIVPRVCPAQYLEALLKRAVAEAEAKLDAVG